jgi:hypothetical protein
MGLMVDAYRVEVLTPSCNALCIGILAIVPTLFIGAIAWPDAAAVSGQPSR